MLKQLFNSEFIMTVITRFAPSPTGYLHIGSVRTALFCLLYAKKMKGKFILRIEDTDLERSTPESVQAILDGMAWLNLNYDEGPYYQTKHFDRYRDVMNQLLKEKKAYKCYCSKERLEQLRNEQTARKEKPRYDGFCRDREDQKGDTYVVRFRNPLDGVVEFNDLVRGKVVFSNQELDDLIIARSDGTPTYNFTVVVDDFDMKITHVIRGDDHINNTPRQINIFRALNVTPPHYAHVPMILGSDGKRLSKRHGAVSVMQYREEGFLPEALLNYLVRLGWAHGDQEIFSMEEMIRYFEINNINNSPAAFNPEKLIWLNQHYIKNGDPQHVVKELAWHMKRFNIDTTRGPDLVEILKAQSERSKTLKEMAEKSRYFYEAPQYNQDAVSKNLTKEILPAIHAIRDELKNLKEWTKENIHHVMNTVAEKMNLKLGKIAQPIRVCVTGDTISPSIDMTLFLLGQDESIKRLNQADFLIDKGGVAP